jgi:hypothetical protein
MSLTLIERRNKMLAQSMVFRALPDLPVELLNLNIERARDEVYRRYMFTEEHRFRVSVSVSNGASLPADFGMYANRGFHNADNSPLKFMQPSQIGSRTNNTWGAAKNSDGSILFGNGLIYLYPQGTIGACTVFYYAKQPRLAGQPDSTTDTMPPDTEDAIVAGGYIRTLQMLVEEKERYALDMAQVKAVTDSLNELQSGYVYSQNEDPRNK